MQSDDNQPRQDDESSQVEHTNGLYVCGILCVVAMTLLCVVAMTLLCVVAMTLKEHCMLGTFDGEWFGMYYYLRHQTKGITNIYFYSHNHMGLYRHRGGWTRFMRS